MNRRLSLGVAVLCAASLLSGCFSDRPAPVKPPANPPATPQPPNPAPDPIQTYALSATVNGLSGTGLQLAGGGNTVSVSQDGTVELASGLTSGTAYSVTIAAQPAAPRQLCTVENAAGTVGSADATVAVTCTNAVRLAAQVTDAPIAHASVSVKVGDKVYTTVADANGMFAITIPILSGTGSQMVLAEAQGADGQTHVNFANLLGTLDAVAAQATGDGDIDSTTNPAVNVTNVSTAKFVLVVQANDGEIPDTNEALQTAERSVNATAMMNLAAAIKLIVDDPDNFELPAGKTSIMEFASDPASVQAFIDAAPAGALEQALTEILADTSLVPGYKAADVPGIYFSIPAAKPGFLSPQGSGLVFNDDGTGEFLTSGAGGLPVTAAFEWEVIDGIVKVRYDHPVSTDSFVAIPDSATDAQRTALQCASVFQVTRHATLSEREYSLLSSGALVDQVRVTALTEYAYEPVEISAGCGGGVVQLAPPAPTVAEGTTEIWKHAALPDMPFTAGELVGREWGIYLLVTSPSFRFSAAQIEFYGDGTADLDGAGTAQWSINQYGDLILSYGDWVQEITKLQISGDAVKTVMVFTNKHDGNQRFAYFDLAVRKDPTLLAGGAEALWLNDDGKFWNAYTNGWSPGAWDGETPVFGAGAMSFGWSFSAGNVAWNHQFYYELIDGIQRASAWHREMRWEMDEASEHDGWIGFFGPYYNPCYNDFNPTITCQRRDWVPLGKNAAGYLYVLEAVHETNDDGGTWVQHPNIAPRLTPVRQTAFPAWQQEGSSFIQP